MEKKDICIGNMECAACSASVERVLKKLDGVQNVSVNLATEKAHVEYDTTKVTLEKIEQTIVKTGFTVVQEEAEQKEIKDKSQISRKIRLILSVAITTALMILSMVFSAFPVVQCILASMVMITGYTFYTKGYKNLFLLHPNMDSLVAVGTSASYLYSLYNLLKGNETHLYFDGVATIITLVMLGKYLESRSKDKTGQAIRNLMQLQSDTAT
ncbi:MAG: cation transporter, partial [Sphaerochaetaceae bacterium]